MADDHIVISSGRSLTPDEVVSRTFTTSFRGFDQAEVRLFLKRIGDELVSLAENEQHLRRSLDEARERAAHPELDENALTAALGEQTTRVFQSAREAAADIRQKAEESAARVRSEAEDSAARLREEAEAVLNQRIDEANRVAAGMREAAMEESAALREKATAEAAAELESARAQGKEMVGEAQAVRERLLTDLARRRRLGHVQVEQLRAGRERLLDAYRLVRRTLDEVTEELSVAEAEARLAAESAARRIAAEGPALTALEMEAELAASDGAARAGTESLATDDAVSGEAVPDETVRGETVPGETVADTATDAGADVAARSKASGRRGSGLRILGQRRRTPDAEEGATLVEVHPPSDDEGVRVLVDEPFVGAPTPSVDEIFSRIRADREAAAQAEQPHNGSADAEPAAPAESPEPPAADAPPAQDDTRVEPGAGDADESALQERDAVLEPLNAQLVRKLKRALQDEQNEVLDRLRTARGTSQPDAVLLSVVDQARRYRDVAEPLLARAAEAGVRCVPSGDRKVEPAAVARDLAVDLASDFVGPLRDRLERALKASPEDAEATVASLGAGYRQWKAERIEPVARQHLAAAFTLGVYRASVEDASLRWLVDDDEGACPDCDDNALAGPTRKGETFPTGQAYPPAHAGCRCLLVPATGR